MTFCIVLCRSAEQGIMGTRTKATGRRFPCRKFLTMPLQHTRFSPGIKLLYIMQC